MKRLYTTKEHFDDFWTIVQRHVLHKFEWHKLTLDDYLKMGTIERANKFSLPKGLLERMGRFIDETGTYQRHAMQFIRQLEEQGRVIYHAKVTRFYTTSGKRFDLPPWIEITPYQLQALLAENKSGKFELTERQKKLVRRYFPRNDETPEEKQPSGDTISTNQPEEKKMDNQRFAANIPQEDDMTETEQTTEKRQVKSAPRPRAPKEYCDAQCDIDKELRRMKNAMTREELQAAKVKLVELLKLYSPYYSDMCKRKVSAAKYYIDSFKMRVSA